MQKHLIIQCDLDSKTSKMQLVYHSDLRGLHESIYAVKMSEFFDSMTVQKLMWNSYMQQSYS